MRKLGQLIRALVGLFEGIPDSAISLLARIVIGLVFLNSGLTKVDGLRRAAGYLVGWFQSGPVSYVRA